MHIASAASFKHSKLIAKVHRDNPSFGTWRYEMPNPAS
ncbi:MAG: hypothetical protein JWM91_3600 [Rhodospirillales bacterium]|nr:hypothetical protein [Rhodospirillales bacterium]